MLCAAPECRCSRPSAITGVAVINKMLVISIYRSKIAEKFINGTAAMVIPHDNENIESRPAIIAGRCRVENRWLEGCVNPGEIGPAATLFQDR